MSALPDRMPHWWWLLPALTTLNQICIKYLAQHLEAIPFGQSWLLAAASSYWMIGILFCEVASFVLWIKLITHIPVSRAVPLTAVAYLMILISSWLVFDEKLQLLQIVGSAFILCGVWSIGFASEDGPKESST